jgi:CheY-specific phosphatase CheX
MTVPADMICASIGNLFETMYFSEAVSSEAGQLSSPLMAASVTFSGPVTGVLTLAATGRLAAQLAAEFVAAEAEDLGPGQAAAIIQELANVACGSFLAEWMPHAPFEFGIPVSLDAVPPDRVWLLRFGIGSSIPELAVDVRLSSVENSGNQAR